MPNPKVTFAHEKRNNHQIGVLACVTAESQIKQATVSPEAEAVGAGTVPSLATVRMV